MALVDHGVPLDQAPLSLPADPREMLTIESAARLLHLSEHALRARCRRSVRRVGRQLVAYLGAGITAYKFGKTWRVRLSNA